MFKLIFSTTGAILIMYTVELKDKKASLKFVKKEGGITEATNIDLSYLVPFGPGNKDQMASYVDPSNGNQLVFRASKRKGPNPFRIEVWSITPKLLKDAAGNSCSYMKFSGPSMDNMRNLDRSEGHPNWLARRLQEVTPHTYSLCRILGDYNDSWGLTKFDGEFIRLRSRLFNDPESVFASTVQGVKNFTFWKNVCCKRQGWGGKDSGINCLWFAPGKKKGGKGDKDVTFVFAPGFKPHQNLALIFKGTKIGGLMATDESQWRVKLVPFKSKTDKVDTPDNQKSSNEPFLLDSSSASDEIPDDDEMIVTQ